MGEDPPGVQRQKDQQLELLGGQPDLVAVPEHSKPLAVDDEVAAGNRPARGRRALRAAHRGANPREQFLGAKWLGHVVVGTGVERPHLVAFGPARGQDDHRHALVSRTLGTPRRHPCRAGRDRGR